MWWQCSYTTVVFLSISLWAFTHTSATVVESDCVQLDFQQYTASLPVTYQGTPTAPTAVECLVEDTIRCGNNQRLNNGVLDPADFETGVHAWNENADIILIFSSVVVKYVNLFFYNAPQATGGPVGLPSFDLAYSNTDPNVQLNPTSLHHTILGNQDLSQSDSLMGYRNVSVVVPTPLTESTQGYNFFRIRLLFPETDVVDWTLLSEIQAFGNTDAARCSVMNVPDGSETITLQEGDSSMLLGPDNVVSTVTLSCTVTNEGLYQIQWVLPDMTTMESTWVADGSRTGILQVSQLSGAGDMDYQCRASYVPEGLPSGSPSSSMATATFTLDLQAELKVQEDLVTTLAGESVTLGCELYGYAGGSSEIEWKMNNEQLENDSEFTITVVEGNRTLQNGGDVPGPSMVSLLTISNPATSHSGLYVCTVSLGGESELATVMLTVMNTTEEPTDGPSGDGSSDSVIAPIIGGVMGGLLCGILLVFILAVTAVAIIRKRREKAPIQDYDYVSPPELPPRPQVITTSCNVAYASSNAIQGMCNAAFADHMTIQTQANTAYTSDLEMQP